MAKKNDNKATLGFMEAKKASADSINQLVKFRVSLDASLLQEKGGVVALKRNIRNMNRIIAINNRSVK